MLSQVKSIVVGLAIVMTGSAQGQERDIKISMSSASLATASVRIAQELGLFKKHGLKPNFIVMDSSNVATMGLISGSVDFTVGGPARK